MTNHDDALSPDEEASVNWLIEKLHDQAGRLELQFGDWDEWALRQPAQTFSEEDMPHVIDTHNRTVHLARTCMIAQWQASPHYSEDEGWGVPEDWRIHYESLVAGDGQRLISLAINSAIFGNPFDPAETAEVDENGEIIPAEDGTKAGMSAMIAGLVTAAIGTAITVGTYMAASGGGVYLVAWGAIIFGAIQAIWGAITYFAK